MSGTEWIPGAAGAAKQAAGEALSSSAREKEALLEVAKDLPEMRDAAQALAKRVAIKQVVLLKLYQPLARLVGIQREYFDTDFARELAEKTSDIPDEHLVSPSPALAFPAMQGLGYSLEEEDLKEMYLNLLATATDGRRTDDAHPAFSEVIRQLSPSEAGVLLSVLAFGNVPVAQIHESTEGQPGYMLHANNLTPLRDKTTRERLTSSKTGIWVDNWIRLGLVVVRYDANLTNEALYSWCESHPEFLSATQLSKPGATFNIQRGYMGPTDFGARFGSAVSTPSESGTDIPRDHMTAYVDPAESP